MVPTVKIRRLLLRFMGVILCAWAPAGCSGEYILTVPDQVVPAGGKANVVMRLERYEFASLRTSVEGAPIRFQVGKLLERCAYTDELGFTGTLTDEGYAGTDVPVPKKPGKYVLTVSLQDDAGDEAHAEAPVYVWGPDRPVTAVDLDSLPSADDDEAGDAKAAMARIAESSHVVYLTRDDVDDKADARAKLTTCGYPDGPVLTWRRSTIHFARVGPLRLPQFIHESRLVMHMKYLRRRLPSLQTGVCTTENAAREFAKAGIRPVLVGDKDAEGLTVTRRTDWADLAGKGTGP